MRRQLPTAEHVKEAMLTEISDAQASGRRATVSSVERALAVPHATFARNYAGLIGWFKEQVAHASAEPSKRDRTAVVDTDPTQRLRDENRELRLIVEIYAAEIERLTVDNNRLVEALAQPSNVRGLPPMRKA